MFPPLNANRSRDQESIPECVLLLLIPQTRSETTRSNLVPSATRDTILRSKDQSSWSYLCR